MLSLLLGPPGKPRSRGDDDLWTIVGGGGLTRVRTEAGPIVDEELALLCSTVWCCTRVICETIAGLPLQLYRRQGGDSREVADDHHAYEVMKWRPNSDVGSMVFREGRTHHQVNWGGGFGEIELDKHNRLFDVHPIHAGRVGPAQPAWRKAGYRYEVRQNDGSSIHLKANEMLHVPGVLSEDGIWAKGVIAYAAESIGFHLGTERHGASFFGSGGQPAGVLSVPGMNDSDKRREFRKEWRTIHKQPGELAIIPVEGKYTPITIPNEQAQFLETRKLNASVIGSQWYKVPPHAFGDLERSQHNNIEHQGIDLVVHCLMPWALRWEEQLALKLLTPAERRELYWEHVFAGLLRGDLKSRYDAYQQALINGFLTINEVRRLENLPGIGPAGDVHYVQGNLTTAEKLLAGVRQQEETPPQAGLVNAARGVLADTITRLAAKEANALRRYTDRDDFEGRARAFFEGHEPLLRAALASGVNVYAAVGQPLQAGRLAARLCRLGLETLAQAKRSGRLAQDLKRWDAIREGHLDACLE
jgi:HK97 family phage portal protein